jgi:hypothetical protein
MSKLPVEFLDGYDDQAIGSFLGLAESEAELRDMIDFLIGHREGLRDDALRELERKIGELLDQLEPLKRAELLLSYSHLYLGNKAKAAWGMEVGCGCWQRKWGLPANCRAFCNSETDFRPAIRCLRRVLRLPLQIAQVLGHTSTGRAPGLHPDGLPATLGIIAEGGCERPAEHGVRKDPSPGSARFPDRAGCGRRPAGL